MSEAVKEADAPKKGDETPAPVSKTQVPDPYAAQRAKRQASADRAKLPPGERRAHYRETVGLKHGGSVVRTPPKLPPSKLHLSQHEFAIHVADIDAENGVTPEDIRDPMYWVHVHRKMRPYDHIHARANNGEWYQELLVYDVGDGGVRTRPLTDVIRLTGKGDEPAVDAAEILVEFKGPEKKYCVLRKRPSEPPVILTSGHLKEVANQIAAAYRSGGGV